MARAARAKLSAEMVMVVPQEWGCVGLRSGCVAMCLCVLRLEAESEADVLVRLIRPK